MNRAGLFSETSSVVAMTVQIDPWLIAKPRRKSQHCEQSHARPDFHACVRKAQPGNVHEEFARSATGIAPCASFSRVEIHINHLIRFILILSLRSCDLLL
jgi:hypothetical protein